MVRQYRDSLSRIEHDVVFRAVTGEDRTAGIVGIMHMAANLYDRKAAQNTEIDPSVIVAINHHQVRILKIVLGAKHLFVETL